MTGLPEILALLQFTGQNIALFSGGLFSGAAIYISLTECPPRTALGFEELLALAKSVARRTNTILSVLAVVTALSAVLSSIAGGGVWWLAGGLAHLLIAGYLATDVRRVTTHLEQMDTQGEHQTETEKLLQQRAMQIALLSLAGLFAQYVFIVNG